MQNLGRRTRGWIVAATMLLAASLTACTSKSQTTVSESDASAKQETCMIEVEGMTCATCPIQVRAAMARIDGVRDVDVSFKNKLATVVFDPDKTTPEKIAAAATGIGFPSTPKAK